MDDKQRIALVETRNAVNDGSPVQLIRYQLGNHLGSASLELSEKANIISYEEYTPYGNTSYQAVDHAIKAAAKRYRYTGKERDEETGLSYHSARYYAPWIGRWSSSDPAGLVDGPNLYRYALNNPIRLFDPSGNQTVGDDLTFFATSPMRRVEMAPHVDEATAVKGNLAGGVAGSPSDLANKQFLDPRTNSQTKSNFVNNTPVNPRPNVSAAASPQEAGNRLLTGRWSEVDEMHPLADDATSRTGAGLRTNGPLRANMKADPAIRGALSSVGVNPDTLKAENPPGVQQFPKTGILNLSPKDADIDAATGKVVPGPNTTAAQSRRAQGQTPATQAPVPTKASSQSNGGASGGGSRGGSAAISNLRSGTANLAGGVGRMVPGVVEGEMGLTGAAVLASSHAPGLVTPLLTAAEALPVVAGAAVIGAGVGHLVRAGASAAGADTQTANGLGLGAAILTGAAIGSVIPGVGTAVGAGIGALVAGGLYLWSL
jgi:RHS repeat-associated protein